MKRHGAYLAVVCFYIKMTGVIIAGIEQDAFR